MDDMAAGRDSGRLFHASGGEFRTAGARGIFADSEIFATFTSVTEILLDDPYKHMLRLLALLTAFVWLHGAATIRSENRGAHVADSYTEPLSEWTVRMLSNDAKEHIASGTPYDHQTTLALRARRGLHGFRSMTGSASYGIPAPPATCHSTPIHHTANSCAPIPLRRSMFCVYRI